MHSHYDIQRGFTLVELSVVLVIIALLIGGILGAKSLLKASSQRAVISEISAFDSAIKTFELQYSSIPGDMELAAAYWPGIATDGNGNSRVDIDNRYEFLKIWQHLSLSRIFPGDYTGNVSGGNYIIGVNLPPSKVDDATTMFGFQPTVAPFDRSGHVLLWGGLVNNTAAAAVTGVITPADAHSIDVKTDDGIALTGEMYGIEGFFDATPCLDGSNNYDLDRTDKSCTLGFWYD